MTRTKNKTATQTQVIALAVLGLAAAAGFGYIGYSLPKQAISPTPPSTRTASPLLPPGYNPGGYQPPGYNPPGYNPPGYNPPGYSMVGKPGVAKLPCSTVGWDVNPGPVPLAKVPKSSVIKGSGTTLYWYSADGMRYVFPNEATYRSWYVFGVCPKIATLSDSDLAKIVIRGPVWNRPGTRLIKLELNPTIYAVAKYGSLRSFQNTGVISAIYGAGWMNLVDVVPDGLFVGYYGGPTITQAGDFDPAAEQAGIVTIDDNIPNP